MSRASVQVDGEVVGAIGPGLLAFVGVTHDDGPEQARRLLVRPGLTGWAQVTGRASHSHGAKMAADGFYVDHASLLLDLRIIARTFVVAVLGREAY